MRYISKTEKKGRGEGNGAMERFEQLLRYDAENFELDDEKSEILLQRILQEIVAIEKDKEELS